MSGHVADLFADLSLRTTRFSTGLTAAVLASRNAGSSMSRSFGTGPQAALSATDRAARRMSDNVSGYMKDVSRIITGILISQAFYGLIRTIREASQEVYEFSLNMEQSAVAFEYMMHSATKSQQFLGDLEDLAALTPFAMEDTTRGARRLMAMGFAAENVIPVMRSLADVMALQGTSDPQLISRMTMTLGQIKNSSKVSAREIRELTLAGVPANKILQEELNLTAKQVQNIGQQAIPGAVAIQALMTGINKRYGGAADAIQRTTAGLISTIRDNLLFISKDMLKGPMASYNEYMSGMAQKLEDLRMEGRKFGTGGILNSVFPPGLQTAARVVITSIGSIASSLKRLGAAFGPVIGAINEFIFRGLALILPVVAGVVNALSRIAYAATHSIPAVKYLGAAILGLLGATVATAAVLHLAWAIRILGIAQAVAGAVALLTKAIQFLYLAMAKNPVTAVIMLISAALLGLAMSSATVSAWLDRVMKQMMGLMGMNGDSFALTSDATLGQQDIFNDSLIAGSEAWDEFGDSAAAAGKKINDNIQSFDEVHQLEDPNGTGAGAGAGALPNLKIPDLEIPDPKLPDIKIPKVDLTLVDEQLSKPFILPPPIFSPPIPPPMPTFPVLVLPRPILPLLDLNPITTKLREWAITAGAVLEGWRTAGTQTVQGWVSDFNQLLDGWWANGTKSISNWAITAGAILGDGLANMGKSISNWAITSRQYLGDGLANMRKSISSWGSKAGAILGDGLANMGKSISSWGSEAALAFTNILNGIVTQFGVWRTNLGISVNETLEGIKTFFVKWGPTILLAVGVIIAGIVLCWVGLPVTLAAGAFAALLTLVGVTFGDVKTVAASESKDAGDQVVGRWQSTNDRLGDLWESLKTITKDKWSGIGQVIKESINSIINLINKLTGLWNGLSFKTPTITLPGGYTFGGGTIGVPQIPKIKHLAQGGVVTKDQIVRVAEAGTSEGVIPLQGSGAAAVANALADMIIDRMHKAPSGNTSGGPTLSVGTLIGDERSYMELERRLRKMRVIETARGVG